MDSAPSCVREPELSLPYGCFDEVESPERPILGCVEADALLDQPPRTAFFTRTLRLKVRPEAYAWLNRAAVEVNQVFNWANQVSMDGLRARCASASARHGLSGQGRRPRRARKAHRAARRDEAWSDWYAEYLIAEQAGKPLPA